MDEDKIKFYIYQLQNSNMLVYNGTDDKIEIEDTGYPLPDCKLGSVTGKDKVMKAILGYDITNITEFISKINTLEGLSFKEFKYTIWAKCIGKGCPRELHDIGVAIIRDGFSELQAFYKNMYSKNKDFKDIDYPEESYLEQHKNLIFNDWKIIEHRYNSMISSNHVLYKDIKDLDKDKFDFFVDMMSRCLDSSKFCELKYANGFIAPNGLGCIVFSDTESNNAPYEFFYTSITPAKLCDGIVSCKFEDDNIEISFESDEEYYSNLKPFKGKLLKGVVNNDSK